MRQRLNTSDAGAFISMATDQLTLRDQQRFEFSSAFTQSKMEIIKEFTEHPLSDFNKNGLFADLLKKLYKTHLNIQLTPRESELLLFMASGFTREHIQREMFIGVDRFHGLRFSIAKKMRESGIDSNEFDIGSMMILVTLRVMGQLV